MTNVLALKWFRLLLGSAGLLVWLAWYLIVGFTHRDLRRLRIPLRISVFLLVAGWVGFLVTDYERIASILQANWLFLICAGNWLTLHYRTTPPTMITTLGLSDSQSTGARDGVSGQ